MCMTVRVSVCGCVVHVFSCAIRVCAHLWESACDIYVCVQVYESAYTHVCL